MNEEFREIAHSGGKIKFTISSDDEGRSQYQISVSSSRPVPVVMIAIYALPQGIPVGSIQLGGIGTPWNPPPFAGCYPVMIQSDSHGHFGHHCPRCGGYWRSGPWPSVCPYCNFNAEGYQFLSKAQLKFVRHYCAVLMDALDEIESGEVTIDMDEVADAAEKNVADRPAFYIAEESQQHKFKCKSCDEFNDILGRFGYCSLCGTRNDLTEFEDSTAIVIRNRLNSGAQPQDCVRDVVAAFDTLVSQYAKQLAAQVPMTSRRVTRLTKFSFHDLDETRNILKDWFDIDIYAGIKDSDIDQAKRMFHRRHLYEHNGGEVDEKYLQKSGDKTVRLKQVIRESQEGAHALLGTLSRMARNLHAGFHELIDVVDEPIQAFEKKKRRIEVPQNDR
jgi:Zn finger protein HypA/HybF involved in hydrogenase expression